MSKSFAPVPTDVHAGSGARRYSIFSILEEHASGQPDTPAIIREDLTLTYAELFGRVRTCATGLVHQGLRPGEVTGISLSEEIDNLICAMALSCLGTPQISLGSHETDANRQALARTLGVTQIVAAQPETWMGGATFLSPPISANETAGSATAEDVLQTMPLNAIVFYRTTSGSTNVPKAFGLSLERLFLAAKRLAETPNERRVLRTSSMEFDSTRLHRICALLAGNTCVFSRELDLATLGELCARAEISDIHMGTYKLESLLRGRAQHCQKLPSFTRVVSGGSRVPGPLRNAVKERITDNFWVSYATSELGPISMASPEQHHAYPEGVGFPMPGVEVTVIDSNGELLPDGEIGQARIRKAAMPLEYLNDTVASSAFRDGWFYPGDLLSRIKDGPLVFHGRVDDMMILNGINIFPAAIEDVLESHPDVREAVAYPVKSRVHGEIPVAAVVLKEGAQGCDASRLLDHCRKVLGIRAPRQVLVVEQIPRNWAGKPLRRELAAS